MALYQRAGIWWIDIQIKGQPRLRKSTGVTDKATAQRIHDETKAALWQRRAAGHTWHDAAAAWLADSERDLKDRYRLRALLGALPDRPLADLTTAALTEALAGQSPGNHNRNRALIVAILNTAHLRGWLADVPHIPTKRVTAPRIRFLSREEWQRLLAELPSHLKPMARLAIATGLRRHNVTHLEWSQVDLARRVAWIHADQAKSGKPIGVPLSTDAVDTLRGQIGQHARWVFPTHRGAPQVQISTGWKAALKRAGIEDSFRWHDLRHTWASWHVMAGTPLEVLQKLGGWSSLAMVLRYAHLAPDHLAGYADNARPWEGGQGSEKAA
jgi:integrase